MRFQRSGWELGIAERSIVFLGLNILPDYALSFGASYAEETPKHEVSSDMSYYVTIWQFDIDPSMRAAFEQTYGPDGDWAVLFRRSPDYVRTDLVRDTAEPNRYLTLDYWQTQAAYSAFRSAHQHEYAALDAQCSRFTTREIHLGSFTSVSGNLSQ